MTFFKQHLILGIVLFTLFFLFILGFLFNKYFWFENKILIIDNFLQNSITDPQYFDIQNADLNVNLNIESENKDYIKNVLFYKNPVSLKQDINYFKLNLIISDKYEIERNKIQLTFSGSLTINKNIIPLDFEVIWDPLKDFDNPTLVKFNKKIDSSIIDKYFIIEDKEDKENTKNFITFLNKIKIGSFENYPDLVNTMFFINYKSNPIQTIYNSMIKSNPWIRNSNSGSLKNLLNNLTTYTNYEWKSSFNALPFYSYKVYDLPFNSLSTETKQYMLSNASWSILEPYVSNLISSAKGGCFFSINPNYFFFKDLSFYIHSPIFTFDFSINFNSINK